ncbi:aminoglycoside phosphotransferase family protein [Candidatus Saccharibacteria bacterium]|nr:aminoglycoside phosphotransferase family protein [Candidatus Saccharibacteria bacterium]MBQ3263888.1 aminoglycoside phosphotransferase family protein [Candidatus Saccharibacteria bacterium]
MADFFTTKDPLDQIIQKTFPEKKILDTKHILTGWTNIVIEVKTNQGSYFFRFPRNPFWSKMIVKDAAVCNFVDGKTSFYTPQMQLHYDEKHRPFSVHQKIEGYTLGDRIYHLSHTALTGAAYDVAKFIKELSGIDLRNAPDKVKYPLSKFLHELDYEHYDHHIDADHAYIKKTEEKKLVHGDLNLGNILLDKDDKVIGVIDFCFAGLGNPQMDTARMLSRPVPKEFEDSFLAEFTDTSKVPRMKAAWQHIDAGYANHIRTHFPEITLPEL